MTPGLRWGSVWLVDLPGGYGRRPAVVVTRDVVLPFLSNATVVPITSTVRGIPTEVALGPADGVRDGSVASCDNVSTIPQRTLVRPLGQVGPGAARELRVAIRTALDLD